MFFGAAKIPLADKKRDEYIALFSPLYAILDQRRKGRVRDMAPPLYVSVFLLLVWEGRGEPLGVGQQPKIVSRSSFLVEIFMRRWAVRFIRYGYLLLRPFSLWERQFCHSHCCLTSASSTKRCNFESVRIV